MKIQDLKYGIICLMTTLSMASCDKEKYMGSPAEEATTITSIQIVETDYHLDAANICLLTGQELQLNYIILPSEGITFPEIEWTSSEESIVSVSETGKIRALEAGTAIIRATPSIGFGPVAATPSITVKVVNQYVYMSSVSIGQVPALTDSIAVGETVQLSASHTTTGGTATFVRYKWSSSDPLVVTVNDNGLVTGTGEGKATITVEADDPNPNQRPKASVTIDVRKTIAVETLVIHSDDPELSILGYGQEYQLVFDVTPADATLSAIKWESDNPSAVSVSKSGKLTVNTMDGAMAVITATAGNIVRTVNVAVAQGRLCYSFAQSFTPWTVTTAGAAVGSSDGEKTTIQMTNPSNEGSTKHRGDINLVTNGSGNLLTLNLSTYRYLAVKIQFPTVLVAGTNSNGCIKVELFDNPRTIGPTFTNGKSNSNNQYTIWGGGSITTESPNVLYFDLQAGYDTFTPTSWTNPFNLVQFKFVIADYPVAAPWTYDIYWVRTFKSIEELAAFASSN